MTDRERIGWFPSTEELQKKVLYLELLSGSLKERLQGSGPFTSTELHEYQAALEDLARSLSDYHGPQDTTKVKMMVEHCLNLIEEHSTNSPTDPRIEIPPQTVTDPLKENAKIATEEGLNQLMLTIHARLLREGKTAKYVAVASQKIEKEIRTIVRSIASTNSPEALLDYLAKILSSSRDYGQGFLTTGHMHDLSDAEKDATIKIIRNVGELRLISLSQTLGFDLDKFLTARIRFYIKT